MDCWFRAFLCACVLLSHFVPVSWCGRRRAAGITTSALEVAGKFDTVDHLLAIYNPVHVTKRGRETMNPRKALMKARILRNQEVLGALLAKQKKYRMDGVHVGVHSKSPKGMLLHILNSLGIMSINQQDELRVMKGKIVEYFARMFQAKDANNPTLEEHIKVDLTKYESYSLASGSFSVLDTTPGFECFIDYYLERATSFGTRHNQSGHAEETNDAVEESEMEAVQNLMLETVPDVALVSLTEDLRRQVTDAFKKYKDEIKASKIKGKFSANVPFLVKATVKLTQKRAQYSWIDEFANFAYVSSPFGFPVFFDKNEGDPEELFPGTVVTKMTEAFEAWISLAGDAAASEVSWTQLANKNLQANADSEGEGSFSQLRVPYRYVYPEDQAKFEFEPVYHGMDRLKSDLTLCNALEAIFAPPKSAFCARLRQMKWCQKKTGIGCLFSTTKCETRLAQEECENPNSFGFSVCCEWTSV